MLLLSVDPLRLLPYHEPIAKRLRPWGPSDGGMNAPPIPVFDVPDDLTLSDGSLAREHGDYVLYNGHHRRWAAILARVPLVEIAVLECDDDMRVNNGTEQLRMRPRHRAFELHRLAIYKNVQQKTLRVLAFEATVLAARD
jgi:hypothetical protein